jgi:hypothetical protein
MTAVIFDRQILLDLSDHVPAQVHIAQVIRISAKIENNGAGELIVCPSGAVLRLKDMYAIPASRRLGRRRNS